MGVIQSRLITIIVLELGQSVIRRIMFRKKIYLVPLFIFALPGCAHQPELQPQLSGEERAAACQKAHEDSDRFCHNMAGTSYWFREKLCSDALKRVRQYCD